MQHRTCIKSRAGLFVQQKSLPSLALLFINGQGTSWKSISPSSPSQFDEVASESFFPCFCRKLVHASWYASHFGQTSVIELVPCSPTLTFRSKSISWTRSVKRDWLRRAFICASLFSSSILPTSFLSPVLKSKFQSLFKVDPAKLDERSLGNSLDAKYARHA